MSNENPDCKHYKNTLKRLNSRKKKIDKAREIKDPNKKIKKDEMDFIRNYSDKVKALKKNCPREAQEYTSYRMERGYTILKDADAEQKKRMGVKSDEARKKLKKRIENRGKKGGTRKRKTRFKRTRRKRRTKRQRKRKTRRQRKRRR